MRRILITVGLLTAMTVILNQSQAQFDPETGKIMRAVGKVLADNPAAYAANQGVQKELKLDEDQVKAISEKVPAQFGFGFGGGGGKGGKGKFDPDQFKERMAKMMEKYEKLKDVPEDKMEEKIREVFKEELEGPAKEVEKILKPEQLARLKQIARQQGGAAAYLKPENVKDLSITDEQKGKLKEITTQLDKDLAELRGSGGKGGFAVTPETREKMTALSKEAKEKADTLLTDTQKSKWKELTGEPFTVQFGGGRTRPKKDD